MPIRFSSKCRRILSRDQQRSIDRSGFYDSMNMVHDLAAQNAYPSQAGNKSFFS